MNLPFKFPSYSVGERIADGVIHVLSVVASLSALIALMIIAALEQSGLSIFSLAIYGTGLFAVFAVSAAYNLTHRPRWKEVLRRLDHAVIYVMIAGTYTPLSMIAIGGAVGYGLLTAVWVAAIAGVVIKLVFPRRLERTALALYLAQGWAIVLAIDPLVSAVSVSSLTLLIVGGACYTVGVLFHLWRRLPYHNAIWHFMVLAGATCHYIAVLDSVALA